MHIILLRHKTAAQVAENSSPFIHPWRSLPPSMGSYPKKRPVGLHLLPHYCLNTLTLADPSGRAGAHLLGLRVRIPQGAWMSVCCECCVLSGTGLRVELIALREKSYRVWWVWVWSQSLDIEEVLAHWGLLRQQKKLSNSMTLNGVMKRYIKIK